MSNRAAVQNISMQRPKQGRFKPSQEMRTVAAVFQPMSGKVADGIGLTALAAANAAYSCGDGIVCDGKSTTARLETVKILISTEKKEILRRPV